MVAETPIDISVDPGAAAAYISLAPSRRHIAESIALDLPALPGDVTLDFDEEGRLIGIEIIGVRKVLDRELLARWGMAPDLGGSQVRDQ